MTKQPNWLTAKNIQKIFTLLSQNSREGRIVGGAVRDHLLGVNIGDVDFCSTHTPQQLIEIAKQNNIRYIETGVKYGTLTLMLDGQPFEVTSLREDVETDGRHAKVIYGNSFKEDAKRRDFTFNALYMNASGEIFDPLGSGIADLADRKIKFIGNASLRIEEDYLRILRYFRFIARFNFEYDKNDYEQISNLVSGLSQLSAERIYAEIKRTYQSPYLINALKLMSDCQICNQLFGTDVDISKLRYLQNNSLSFKNIWLIRFRLSFSNISVKNLNSVLKMSNRDQKTLNQMNQLSGILSSSDAHLAKEIYQSGKPMVVDNLLCFAAETNFNFDKLQQKLNFVKSYEIPALPIKGADLFAKGYEAGPKMGQKIKQLEQQWLASDFSLSKSQLLASL